MGLFAKTLIVHFLFATSLSLAAADNQSIPLFKAEYILQHNKLEIGHVELSVKALDRNRYQLTSITHSSGLLSFIHSHKLTESSLFELINGKIRPINYQYLKQSKKQKKDVRLSFNWQKSNVTNTINGQHWSMPISEGVLDKALMQIALMLDTNNSSNTINYQIADGGKLKQYRFKPLGMEEINVAGQTYTTQKFARTKGRHKNITYYWCAPALHNLPVLLQREKNMANLKCVWKKCVLTTPHQPIKVVSSTIS